MNAAIPPSEGDVHRHEFRTLSSATVYAGAIFALRADEVAMPGGGSARREIVEHAGAVAIAPLDERDRLVMIYQYRHPLGRRLWELPAGLLDIDGESPLDTARRELAEETGLTAREWSVLADVAGSPGMTDEVVRIFLARGLATRGREAATDDEEADLRISRIALSDAASMVLSGEIVNGATATGVLATHAVHSGVARARPTDAPWRDRPTRFAARRGSSGA